jgi:hypothetical protein
MRGRHWQVLCVRTCVSPVKDEKNLLPPAGTTRQGLGNSISCPIGVQLRGQRAFLSTSHPKKGCVFSLRSLRWGKKGFPEYSNTPINFKKNPRKKTQGIVFQGIIFELIEITHPAI